MLSNQVDVTFCLSIIGAVAAFFFAYFCILLFWKEIFRIISEMNSFKKMGAWELSLYVIIILILFSLATFSFAQSEAFYGTEYSFDIIYTSDSPILVKNNVYLLLSHPENDLRQPLFSVFAAPFVRIPYLIAKLLGASAPVQAMLIDYIQIVILVLSNYMITKMLKLTPLKRILFMLLAFCTYTQFLFTLMMEQYIIAYFWLIFCMYLVSEKMKSNRIALWGAGGTLLTSMILLPFMS